MKQAQLISKISDLLVQFSNEVSDKAKLKLTDINIISEDILVPILSITYDTDLINLNEEKSNFPGIDLATKDHITYGGKTKKIAFQITSTNNITKIKDTLTGYAKGKFYEKFDEIYIYNLVEKQKSFQASSIKEIEKIIDGKFKFDLGKNIIDRTDIEKKIKALSPISKIEAIHKLLEDQFVYRKKSLLSLEIWESEGKIGYGFSNLINSIDQTTYNTLVKEGISNEAKDLLELVLNNYNVDFGNNYKKEQTDKFKNLGFNTYLKAGFSQVSDSFQIIKPEIKDILDKDSLNIKLSESLKTMNSDLDESNFPLVNNPIEHPAIKFIKTTVSQIFSTFGIHEDLKFLFIGDFNEKIQNRIIETFGKDNYFTHLEDTKDKWIKENEKELLIYMKDLAKLGFVDGEELQFQETYGIWQDVRNYGSIDENYKPTDFKHIDSIVGQLEKISIKENKLKTIEKLIDEYFDHNANQDEGLLNNILFLIADFGKGKTCFLHYFASKLAQQYLKSKEGLFPVYINLNEYDKYANSPSLGVIANYLAKRFKIDIKDEYFKKKNYFFLIDSLDECGELTETNIDKVIKDISEIQNLDNINQRNNRIIISSRPIAIGLKEQITKYKPFPIEIKKDKPDKNEITENFISIYGFKKEQFDNYIEFALKKHFANNLETTLTGFSNKI